ncbi:MAG: mechanosensitive ion channel family protein [Bacteroidales bacterium]
MANNPRNLYIFLLFLLVSSPGIKAQGPSGPGQHVNVTGKSPTYLENPAVWINECYNRLNSLYFFQTERNIDTTALFQKFREHRIIITILKNSFYTNPASLNIRSVYNMKMRVADILADITQWQYKIHKDNELLVEKTKEVLLLKSEIAAFNQKSDSIFKVNFSNVVGRLSMRQQTGETLILDALKKSTAIENKIVDIHTDIYLFYSDICHALKVKETSLINRELPPLWASPPGIYPHSIRDVVVASFQQTLESVKYYGQMSIWRIIIFRVLIVLLCLVPIKIFNDERRKKNILSDTKFTFLEKFPKTASVVMGMALSPVIFVHPPHAFMDFILIGLTFTVTLLTIKNYPRINKPLLILLIAAFLVLYIINFFVTPTFIGRLIYTSSILLIIPLFLVYKHLSTYNLEYQKIVRALLIFMGIHLIAGWILVMLGFYTLGRSVILSAYSLLVIAMIMRIAIHTLLDYLEIIAYFFNKKVKVVKINAGFVHRTTKPLLILSAMIFMVMAYLVNMNIFDLVKAGLSDLMFAPRTIGSATFTLMSILLFFLSVYLSFILASLIRHTFEPEHDQTVKHRSSLGSYLLLLRLLILCAGFAVGILVSGLALTNFAIFLGAMGVGIGFGLQNIVSNLVSGLIIAFERPFVVGDLLEFNNELCKVKEISLRATMVSNNNGADILIPNNTLLSDNLKNWTITNMQRVIELKVQTTHAVNPDQVITILSSCLDGQQNIVREKSTALFAEITDTGFVFNIKLLLADLGKGSLTRSQLLSAIQTEFVKNSIRFPKKNTPADD